MVGDDGTHTMVRDDAGCVDVCVCERNLRLPNRKNRSVTRRGRCTDRSEVNGKKMAKCRRSGSSSTGRPGLN